MFHRHMLPLVSLTFYTSVAWNNITHGVYYSDIINCLLVGMA